MTSAADSQRSWGSVRPLVWGGAAALILLPLIAMKLTEEVSWDVGDFMFAVIMVGAVGLAFERAVGMKASWSYRAGAAVGLGAAFLLTWGNLAVGFIGSEDNPLNQMYFAMPAIAFAGCLLARFHARGMAFALAAAAIAQVAAGGIALYLDYFTGPLTVFFTALWLASAWLFHRAARGDV